MFEHNKRDTQTTKGDNVWIRGKAVQIPRQLPSFDWSCETRVFKGNDNFYILVELNQCYLKMRPQNLQQNIWMWIERLCTGVTLTLLPVAGAFLSGKLMDLRAVSKGTILIYLSLSRILSQCKPIKSKCWTGFINEVINEYVLIRGWAGTMDNSHDNKLTDCCFMTLQSDLKIHRVTPLWWGIRTLIS